MSSARSSERVMELEACRYRLIIVCSSTVNMIFLPITIDLRLKARQPAMSFFVSLPKLLECGVSWPGVSFLGPLRPYKSPSASLSFAAFDLCRLSRHTGAPVSSNRLDRQ